jgi:predicted TIM-barrel fold metal-dependent hydrolase
VFIASIVGYVEAPVPSEPTHARVADRRSPVPTGADLAGSICREANDWLAGVVSKYPSSFAGFAMADLALGRDRS